MSVYDRHLASVCDDECPHCHPAEDPYVWLTATPRRRGLTRLALFVGSWALVGAVVWLTVWAPWPSGAVLATALIVLVVGLWWDGDGAPVDDDVDQGRREGRVELPDPFHRTPPLHIIHVDVDDEAGAS